MQPRRGGPPLSPSASWWCQLLSGAQTRVDVFMGPRPGPQPCKELSSAPGGAQAAGDGPVGMAVGGGEAASPPLLHAGRRVAAVGCPV